MRDFILGLALGAIIVLLIEACIKMQPIPKPPMTIQFDKQVDTSDLNSNDVFRILARKTDTIILTYYY